MDAADRAQVMLNGQVILTLYDRELLSAHTFDTPVPVHPGDRLDILVENMGRVNYSYKLERQRKGIDSAVVINDHQHYGWDMMTLDEEALSAMVPAGCGTPANAPALHSLTFQAPERADTFLALPGWGKGVVWLNGFTLGRFWEKGPQKRLYIPAPLLREGENQLLILETEGRSGEVWLHDEPDLG